MSNDLNPDAIVIPEYETRLLHASSSADQDSIDAITVEYHAARKAASRTVLAPAEKPARKRVPKSPVVKAPTVTPVARPTSHDVTVTRDGDAAATNDVG